MCILVNPDVVINNAFLARKNKKNASLKISALQDFCYILYDEIIKCNISGNRYKYVYFKVDEDDVKEFCNNDKRFVLGNDKVYATKDIFYEDVRKVNAIYGDTIQQSLANARSKFSQLDII